MGRQTEFIFLALVICALMLSSSFQPRGSPNRPVTVTQSAQLQPPEPVQPPLKSTGRQPRSGDAASSRSIAAGGHQKRLRVRLIMLVVNIFPVRRCGTAAHRLRPTRPAARPASARASSGQPPASASLGRLAHVFWLNRPWLVALP